MILRKADWAHYPNAIVHMRTKNKSFLKLAKLQRDLGVEHWYCCLALHDPSLEDVNPHDPSLSLDMKARVQREMMCNHWYFFRECALVPQDGAEPVAFGIHRGSFALIWTFFNNIDIALLLIRQQGKTVAVAALLVYLKRVLKNSRTLLITKDAGLRAETIDKMKKIRDTLPKYLWLHDRMDADNSETFTYKDRNNKLITCIAQGSMAAAQNAGRGLTSARLFSDESAFTRFIRAMLPAALASGTRARKIAEEEGIPYGNVFTTTPGKRDEEDGAFIYKLFHDGYYWDEKLLDVESRELLIEIIRKNITGHRILIHAPFNHRQMGMSDLELYDAIANASGTHEERIRDFGMQWTAGSLKSPLSNEELKWISDSVVKSVPEMEIYKQNFVMRWYYENLDKKAKLEKMHIIGLDTSDAVGRDNISLVMTNSETLETAAAAVINESNLIVFANWLVEVLLKYPKTVLVIERKSSAASIIDVLLLKLPAAGIDPARRIFNRITQERDHDDRDLKEFKKSFRPREESFYETYRKYFGFLTTGTSRKLLYGEVLQSAVRMTRGNVRDKNLAEELLHLVVKDGRVDHRASGHDDCTVAWLLACWFMLFGKNLDFYGVSNRVLMKRGITTADGEEFSEEEYEREQNEQEELLKKINEVCSKIASNRVPSIKSVLDRELRVMLAELKLDTSQAATIAELQELIRNERLKSRYL